MAQTKTRKADGAEPRFARSQAGAIPIRFVDKQGWRAARDALSPLERAQAAAAGFEAASGKHLLLTNETGALSRVLFAEENEGVRRRDPFLVGKLATLLPKGTYRFENAPRDAAMAALAFLLGAYRFSRYRATKPDFPKLVAPDGIDAARIERMAVASCFARDLVNTPANDLGPEELEAALSEIAKEARAKVSVIRGDQLLRRNFPLIHAVGRASSRPPRLVDMSWGPARAPRVTLVGKGVCYDTGGLDIKPSASMALMKKDMGGAAAAAAAARMIMDAKLPVRLRLITPIVENAVSGDSFRTGDVYVSRKGLSVEIGNTDAEGRLILADALALADEDKPDLLIDFATLTGAARVALGPDLPPFYTDDDDLAGEVATAGAEVNDPVWRLPLWPAYESMLEGKISDLNSAPGGGVAGSITAALFLRRFVEQARNWVHFDIYGWTPSDKPGRPQGGEAQAARLVYRLVEKRYGR